MQRWAGWLVALAVVAMMSWLWSSGRLNRTSDRLDEVEQRVVYIICTAVPPTTRNELRALDVDCNEVEAEIRRREPARTREAP